MTQIYGIPKATKGLYIHQVHSILNQLRAWQDELPSDMRVVERSTPRPVAEMFTNVKTYQRLPVLCQAPAPMPEPMPEPYQPKVPSLWKTAVPAASVGGFP